jgi:hypothetical protein
MRIERVVGIAAFLGVALVGPATARADCLDVARKVHSRKEGKTGCFVARDGGKREVTAGSSGACGTNADVYYFDVEEKANEAADRAGPGTTVSPLEVPGCRALWAVTVAELGEARVDVADRADRAAVYRATSVAEVFKTYGRPAFAPRSGLAGQATGAAADAVGEALQILGQIVVDRATQAAYVRLGKVIRAGLGCEREAESTAEGGRALLRLKFPATCEALATLRVQDLAMARTVLVRAMVSDLVAHALDGAGLGGLAAIAPALIGTSAAVPGQPATSAGSVRFASAAMPGRGLGLARTQAPAGPAPRDAVVDSMRELVNPLIGAIISTIADPTRLRHGFTARLVEEEIVSFAFAHKTETNKRLLPLVVAGAALFQCTTEFERHRLAECRISELVDNLDQTKQLDDRGKAVARSVARGMLAAISATEGTAADPAPRARLAAAVAGLFDGLCYALKEATCPPILDAGAPRGDAALVWLSAARGVIEAAVDEDTNRLIASVAAGIQALTDIASSSTEPMTPERRRALRLLAGVVQYASTYGPDKDDATDDQKHQQRTKILESLTADMTQRTDREGEWIFSFGGSFGLFGGRRFRSGESIWSGPLSLSLGAAYQKVASPGLHVEVGLVDLAQYLAFEREPGMSGERAIAVSEPELEDALSLSLKIGAQWGHDIPFFAAVAVGYSPFYEFVGADGATSKMGSLNAGIAIGAYVPLFDAN